MSSKAKTLARTLLRENRKNARSWRVIAREDYNDKIPAGTLCRIATNKGTWLPKNEEALIALGLKRERMSKPIITPIYDMATSALRKALIERKDMPPVDPRIIREFKRLGWIKKDTRTRTR